MSAKRQFGLHHIVFSLTLAILPIAMDIRPRVFLQIPTKFYRSFLEHSPSPRVTDRRFGGGWEDDLPTTHTDLEVTVPRFDRLGCHRPPGLFGEPFDGVLVAHPFRKRQAPYAQR